VALAALYPLPNRNLPAQTSYPRHPSPTARNQFDVRLDHSFRPSDNLFARYSFVDDNLFDPFAGSSETPRYRVTASRFRAVRKTRLWERTHIFTPALLNELRLAFHRVSNGDYQQGQGASINRQLGLPELSTNSRDWGLTLTSVNGFSALGTIPPLPSTEPPTPGRSPTTRPGCGPSTW